MSEPTEILNASLQRVARNLEYPLVLDPRVAEHVEYIARNLTNKAGVRLLMSCLLAKIHMPSFDIRKPYTNISGGDSFSGRTYDERYLTKFIIEHRLPCNSTTAFLTPALRNRNETLVKGMNLVGRPPQLYTYVLDLLDDVQNNRIAADDLLGETIRWLLIIRNEQQQRIESMIKDLRTTQGALPLSSEQTVSLVEQHMNLKDTSRLPVLIIAAAYRAAEQQLGERVLTLKAHNAADKQTGALGDVEITLLNDDEVVTCYEVKDKRVSKEDVDGALHKLFESNKRVDNYVFVTTTPIDIEVQNYAHNLYDETDGIEFVILDTIGFLRHYLHLFHRLRSAFLDMYQSLILAEPQSSVGQPIKEAFLSMRQAAEAD
jgi:DNA adenine methylase